MVYNRSGLLNKALFTAREFRNTANHHYGGGLMGLLKFVYYSFFAVNTFIVVGADLDRCRDLPDNPLDEDFKVLKPTLEELEELRQGKVLPREFYYDQIHGVAKCYVALCGGEIAYIHWIYTKWDFNRFLVLSDGVAELNYNTTLKQFQGRRLMAKMLSYILRDLGSDGYTLALGVLNAKNPPAFKAVVRAGFYEITRIRSIGPFNRKLKI
jgi:GNAT superfamily N-acetyltransferase